MLGSVSMALHHKLCHVLGGSFNLPHAETHTVILPHATAYNALGADAAMARIARALGAPTAAGGLFDLAKRLGAPTSLRELGMPGDGLDKAAMWPCPTPIPIRARWTGQRSGNCWTTHSTGADPLRLEERMADITTDVMIIGTGPAGSATAALLSSYGIDNFMINRYRWLANTPRAHITNQRCMEVLRDLGRNVEEEAYIYGTEQDLMGENVFCVSLAGEELGRMKSWGKHPLSRAEHQLSSPCHMNDLPQTYMEPILFETACSRGTQARMSCEYLSHVQDGEGVHGHLPRQAHQQELHRALQVSGRRRWRNSLVAENEKLPFEARWASAVR